MFSMKHSLSFAIALACFVAACSSPGSTLAKLYTGLHEDVMTPNPDAHDREVFASRQTARIKKVHELFDAKRVVSADDYLWASAILVESDSLEELNNAYEVALEAARLGEDRGFRVAAEACDKQLVKQGMHQRYGTQYMWEPVLGAWRLYPLDPRTSDAERKGMGVEPLEELKKKEALLNARVTKGS